MTATVVLGPPTQPPTGQMVSSIMQRYPLKALFCPPVIFEQLVAESESLEHAKHLNFALYAGGPLSQRTGDLLSQVTDVCQFYGQTETGAVQSLVPRREDWASLEWHPIWGADMQPAVDGAYEMVIHRDPSLAGVRALSCNFPEVEHWNTKDLFRPHPHKPNLWTFYGRADDIIVLSNGEKFNPIPSELTIASHPGVKGALIVGSNQFQPAVIIELEDASKAESLVEELWTTIEKANREAPGQARIVKSLILFATPDKPFDRTAKGTIVRAMTAQKYSVDMEALYTRHMRIYEYDGEKLTRESSVSAITLHVQTCLHEISHSLNTSPKEDIYVHGLDSLKTLELVGMLKARIDVAGSWLSPRLIYENPTIEKLASAIKLHLLSGHGATGNSSTSPIARNSLIASLTEAYTQNLAQSSDKQDLSSTSSRLTVVLTGSTGSLGSQLLRALLVNDSVEKVICLNRSADAEDRQQGLLKNAGTIGGYHTKSVDFIKFELQESDLGLSPAKYAELCEYTDVLIHNAWRVDFNLSLESFEAVHVRGVRQLIDFSLKCKKEAQFMFLSSISAINSPQEPAATNSAVAEEVSSTYHTAQHMGYAESKRLAELILKRANKVTGLPVGILRLGQIGGPVHTQGVWKEEEWVPALVRTSQRMSCLPTGLSDIDWIPVDLVANIIVEIVRTAISTGKFQVCNIVNPHPVPWEVFVTTVRKRIKSISETIPLNQWTRKLSDKYDDSGPSHLTPNPAIKILDFFHALMTTQPEEKRAIVTANAVESSATMANLEPVSEEWINRWLDQWGY